MFQMMDMMKQSDMMKESHLRVLGLSSPGRTFSVVILNQDRKVLKMLMLQRPE
jgi:hypothetical protein